MQNSKSSAFLERIRQLPHFDSLAEVNALAGRFDDAALVQAIIDDRLMTKEDACRHWADSINVAYVDPFASVITDEAIERIPPEIARKVKAIGLYVLNGVLMALFNSERTGKGMAFEVSLFDSMTEWMSYPAYYTEGAGKPLARTGTRHATIAPYGPFKCGDGHVVFFGIQNEREWTALCAQVLDDAALANDPRFLGNPQRMKNRDTLETLIERHFSKFTAAEVMQRLDDASIANASMNTV